MTTTVTIRHDGPGHHDVLVQSVTDYKEGDMDVRRVSAGKRVVAGESLTFAIWKEASLFITEIEKLPIEVAAES